MPAEISYPNERGALGLLNNAGPFETRGHPFFEPRGSNGRACVTCHQPANAMSITPSMAQQRWDATAGKDPLFASSDGANCPDLPRDDAKSHSLLLTKGLFRISLPWPPKREGQPAETEFDIDVVNDPSGCNLNPLYGLHAKTPHISVFRRPRIVANLKYVESERPLGLWQLRSGEVLPLDSETGHRLAGNLMADGRLATLKLQMADAHGTHLDGVTPMSPSDQAKLHQFEMQVYAAQTSDRDGGSLNSAGASMGPKALARGSSAVLSLTPLAPTFPELDAWRTQSTLAAMTWAPMVPLAKTLPVRDRRVGEEHESVAEHAFRDSVARGYDSFMNRQILIRDVGSLNPITGNPVKNACSVCHNMQETGMDNAPGYLGLGTTNYPTATPVPDLPLFKLTCRLDAPPHRYLGRVIYTSDPGRALVTGKCADIGAITAQQLRGLSSRAPYFAGGSAKSLREVVDFYDGRFRIGYTEEEKVDLANFLSIL